MSFAYLTLELVVGFFLLFLIVKISGKKVINQMTPFTFVAAIILSELLGNAVYDEKIGLKYIIYSMVVWGCLLLAVEFLSQKFLPVRGVVEGKPAALIRDGVIDREELKKNKINLNELQSMLRQSNTFSLREVAYCYLESNGTISVLKKSQYQNIVQEDMNLPQKQVYVPVTIIRDGEVLWDEIRELGFDEQWLKEQLKAHQVSKYEDVFVAEWLNGDGLYLQTF